MPFIPPELVTLLGSSVLGGIMQIGSRTLEARRRERLFTLQALNAKAQIISEARRYENRGFAWTRRLISLVAVFFVVAFPKIVAVFFPGVDVHVGYSELKDGFLFFTSEKPVVHWVAMRGLVITPLDTHLLSAIIGLYFGGSLTRQ